MGIVAEFSRAGHRVQRSEVEWALRVLKQRQEESSQAVSVHQNPLASYVDVNGKRITSEGEIVVDRTRGRERARAGNPLGRGSFRPPRTRPPARIEQSCLVHLHV